jgi:hypothetical protein
MLSRPATGMTCMPVIVGVAAAWMGVMKSLLGSERCGCS